jgi:hypothetical protein
VREHRHRERLDVVGDYVVAPVERRPRPAGPQQVERRPRRRAEPQFRRGPGSRAQRDDVLLHLGGDQHPAHRRDELLHGEPGGDRLELVKR